MEDELITVNFIGGSFIIRNNMNGETTLLPLSLALAAPELYTSCKSLLEFIKTYDMGGDWCQDNYPAIRKAREVLARALP